jgi:hypothetical protein
MHTIGIRELYDCDPRPTFIVDCAAQSAAIYHVNTALLEIPQLALSLYSHNALQDWWDPTSRAEARHQTEFRHGRYRWTKFVACNRWLVVTIVEQPPYESELDGHLHEPAQLSRITSPLQPQSETIFTIQRLRMVDWASTSLGPFANWSYELNLLVTTLMLETRPTALFLGPDHVIVYNLAYAAVSGSRHPRILGRSIIDAWYVIQLFILQLL